MESTSRLEPAGTENNDEKITGLRKMVQGLLVSVVTLDSQIGLTTLTFLLSHQSSIHISR